MFHPGRARFFSGWLTSELPFHAIGLQAIGTLNFVRRGALRSKAGRVALGLTAASWATLVALDRQARKQGPVFDRALEEAFHREDVAGTDTATTA
jgi:hypothetical protein